MTKPMAYSRYKKKQVKLESKNDNIIPIPMIFVFVFVKEPAPPAVHSENLLFFFSRHKRKCTPVNLGSYTRHWKLYQTRAQHRDISSYRSLHAPSC